VNGSSNRKGLPKEAKQKIQLKYITKQKYVKGAKEMTEYYVSLVKFLNGSYIKVIADDEMTVRSWLNKELNGLWCSVYAEDRYKEIINKYGGGLIGKTITLTVENGDTYDNY
jgi:hypothetical protein